MKRPQVKVEPLYQYKMVGKILSKVQEKLARDREKSVFRYENGNYTFDGKIISEDKFKTMLKSGNAFWMNWEAKFLANSYAEYGNFDYEGLHEYLSDAASYDEY